MPNYFKTISLLFIFITQTAFSWDGTGHRIISAIAYTHLTATAKQKVDALTTALDDPTYPPLVRFLYISPLPDQWRPNDGSPSIYPHFITNPWSVDGTPTKPINTPNLITALQANKSLLMNDTTSNSAKAAALAYVVHLTEDAHQPLHCITRFSKEFPNGDVGGNLFLIRSKYAKNLHAYWDQSARLMNPANKRYPLNNKQVLQLAEMIEENYPESYFGNAAKDLSAEHWTAESYAIGQQKVYHITLNARPLPAYKDIQKDTAERQMALAGYRVAGLLNQLLSP